ncbi:hypothetical protein [Sphingobacterium yanglingense]|uniref:Homeodomain-like domain-containing protein n=1 Tax=Sphingobacterium yanglingense TaxID=1437280 RepID=A0A4R6WVD2_9SPHI|nr:hypothetical protein [Sphingobacterium yanglingense]TDQ81069.1 hypothetical protein CLV99_0441 [Sphingobacterium yanglingense]
MNTVDPEIDFLKFGLKKEPSLKHTSKKHAGHIVESIIRKQGHNISKLAQNMKISRCTIYNWFQQETLPFDVLVRIGSFINYDFSSDFPEYFSLNPEEKLEINPSQDQSTEGEKVDFWRRKYILLLEKYNEYLWNSTNKLK